MKQKNTGYYHATNEGGNISAWYDFCCEIYRQYGLHTKVIPVTTEEYGLSKAMRPFNSRLDKSKLAEAGFKPLPVWAGCGQALSEGSGSVTDRKSKKIGRLLKKRLR